MSRAQVFDLLYEHEMRTVPVQAAVPSQVPMQGRGLVARLRGLKTLMDVERGSLASWMVSPRTVAS